MLEGNYHIPISVIHEMQQVLPAANCEEDSFCEEMAPVTTDDELFDVGAELDGAETTTEGRVSDLEVCMDEELTAGGPEFALAVVFPFVPRSRFPPPLPRCGKASWLLVAVTLISLACT